MRQVTIIIPTGTRQEVQAVGNYIRIVSAGRSMRVEAPETGEFLDMQPGDAANLSEFKRLAISHSGGADESVTLLIGNNTSAGASSSVTLSPKRSVLPSQVNATVTNASGTLMAANDARAYLFVQNNDATGNVYICLDGAAATAARGIKIPPGGFYESSAAYCSTAIITAIGSIASNANVVTVEG